MEKAKTTQYNAAMYVRLSKEDEISARGEKPESNSISNQKQLILDFVKEHTDINIVSVREDDGYTGTDYDRPDFQRMLDDIRAGVINCVIVKDLSRFGREYINAGKYIDRLFPYYGVRLIAINDNIDTVTLSASNDLNITLKNLMNDNYCRDISIKIRSNLQVKRKNGEFIGAFAPYGYMKSETDKNQLAADPYAAGVVRDIFRWKLEGMSQDTISRKLTAEGILSPLEYKKSRGERLNTQFKTNKQAQWTPVAVRRILTNPVYIGTLVQGIRTRPNYKIKTVIVKEKNEWVVVENAHEAIVSPRTFTLVQRLLKLDTRTSPYEEKVFPLAGLLNCGDCGGSMFRKTTTSGGKKFHYYICTAHKKEGTCSSHQISEKLLEATVLSVLQEHIRTLIELEKCLNIIEKAPMRQIGMKKAEDRMTVVEAELERYRRLKTSAYEDMREGVLSKDDYLDIRGQYDERLASAFTARKQIRKEMDLLLSDTNSAQQQWIQEFVKYKNLQKLNRCVAVECIERIDVYEDKRVEVVFSHASSFQALSEQVREFFGHRKEVM